MINTPPAQPSYLTLTELVFNFALFGGLGYWLAGATGACIGAGVLTARYAYLIWRAASRLSEAPSSDATVGQSLDEPLP